MNSAITEQNSTSMQLTSPKLTQSEFQQLSKLVYDQCGINLSLGKKVMLESRLGKRLRVLNKFSFKDYIEFLTSNDGLKDELVHMIDVVTTNKTDFFREPHHFDFLKNELLPRFVDKTKNTRPFRVWSSACSSGEEPYTLAMVLQDFAQQSRGLTYSITASDISTEVLKKGMLAVYDIARVADIPLPVKQRYLLKSKNTLKPTVRIIPALREKVNFIHLNLMDTKLEIEGDFDAIFCRNVLIYFDRKTQYEVIMKLCSKLRPGGLLFIGHSESLHQFDLPLKQIKPTIFIKK